MFKVASTGIVGAQVTGMEDTEDYIRSSTGSAMESKDIGRACYAGSQAEISWCIRRH